MERDRHNEQDALELFGRIVRRQQQYLHQAAEARAADALRRPDSTFGDCCRLIERLASPADLEFFAIHFPARAHRFRRQRARIYNQALSEAERKWTAALAAAIGGAGTANATTLHARFRWTMLKLRAAGWLYRAGLPAHVDVAGAIEDVRRLLTPPAAVVPIRPV